MYRALILVFAMFAGGPSPNPKSASPADTIPATVPAPPASDADAAAERQLFDLANRARGEAGLPSLTFDEGLTHAAREHAEAMAAQQKLSHQLPGEPSPAQRLAGRTQAHLISAGENVAYAPTVERAQDTLMASPPHRANLLNTQFNVAGFGVARSGNTLYVVQEFGRSLPTYSDKSSSDVIAASIVQMRQGMTALHQTDNGAAQALACAMSKADSLNVPSPQGAYVLKYTAQQPETLPAGAAHLVQTKALRTFSVGTCFARTNTYPNGAYWVALLFY